MARPAPGADRVVRVVEHLAGHPGQAFTLSELARRVGLNKATAHALVHALVAAGWLLRHPDLSVSLGPALAAVGQAVEAAFPGLAAARAEATELTGATGHPAVVSTALGGEIVVLVGDRVAPVGERMPLAPPMGSVFLAWAPPAEADRWLAAADPGERAGFVAVLAAVRQRGFAVGLQAGSRQRLAKAMAELRRPDAVDQKRPAELRRLVRELLDDLGHQGPLLAAIEPDSSYLVDHVAAPVFGPDGRAELAITLVGFPDALGGRALARAGRLVRAAADKATETRGGSKP